MLTARQRKALQFIEEFHEEHSFAPTVREVQAAVGHSSPSSTHHMLTALRNMGLIDWRIETFRTLRVRR